MLPPICEISAAPGSGGKRRPLSRASRWTSPVVTPASTCIRQSSGSNCAHLVQALEADHDAALDRDRAAGEPRAAAARGQRHVVARSTSASPPRPRRRSTEHDGVGVPARRGPSGRRGSGPEARRATRGTRREIHRASVLCRGRTRREEPIEVRSSCGDHRRYRRPAAAVTRAVAPSARLHDHAEQGGRRSKLKAGTTRSRCGQVDIHNFHLTGPGVNKTTASAAGT